MPASLGVAPQDGVSQFPGEPFVPRFRKLGWMNYVSGLRKRRHQAFAHLRGGFPGECNCNNLFRLLNTCEQLEIALDQKPGFTRPCRRLNDKRMSGIDG